MKFGIGQPVPRTEDPRFLKGAGRYVADIMPPNLAHGFVLRSPHAHAAIKSIDTAAAKAAPGVLAVLTGADARADKLGVAALHRAADRLRRAAQGVHGAASGAAARPRALRRRSGRLRGRRDAQPGARRGRADPRRLRGAAGDRRDRRRRASPARRWSGTARPATSGSPWSAATRPRPMRPSPGRACRVAAASSTTGCRPTPWKAAPRSPNTTPTSGTHHAAHLDAAAAQGARQACRRRVPRAGDEVPRGQSPDVGGGFGMKGGVFPEDALVTWAARKTGRPVKWVGGALGKHHERHPRPRQRQRGFARARRRRQVHRPAGRSPTTARAPISRRAPACRPAWARWPTPTSMTSRPRTSRCALSTPTPRRSVPIAAPASRRRST